VKAFIAGCSVPTAQAQVAETMAGIHRTAADKGEQPAKKLAATADILRQILAPIGDDLVGLRDRALLPVGFAGALRRAELAAVHVEHLEARERGLRLTLPRSKGDRTGSGVTVAIPYAPPNSARCARCTAGRTRPASPRSGVPPHLAAALPPQAGRGPPALPRGWHRGD
jgi:hypothetical protein